MKRSHFRCRLSIGLALLLAVPRFGLATSIFDDNWKPPPDSKPPGQTAPPPPPPDVPARPQPARLSTKPPKPAPTHIVEPPKITGTGTFPRPPVQTVSTARRSVPGAAALADTEKTVKEVFGAEYGNKTPIGQLALAHALLAETHNGASADDPASLYVLLSQARDMACAGGDPALAVEAARDLRDGFTIDPATAKDAESSALTSALRTMPGVSVYPIGYNTAHRAAELAMEMAEYDLEQGDYAGAVAMAEQADIAAARTRDWEFPGRVRSRLYQLQEIDKEYELDKTAIASLKTTPKDPAANLAAGRFYGFCAGDWAKAIPLLVKGADPTLKDAPTLDAKATASHQADDALFAADAWADAAKPLPPGAMREAMQRRALSLYDVASAQMSGLAKVAAKKRSDDLHASRLIRGLTGEYFRGAQFQQRAFFRNDLRIDFAWYGQLPEPLLNADGFSVQWTGYIKAAAGRYDLIAIHDDGIRIDVDGQPVLDQWDSIGRHAAKCSLTGAPQPIKVEYRQKGGNSYAGLGWKLPGAKIAKVIPDTAFMHDPPPPGPIYSPLPRNDATGTITLQPGDAIVHGLGTRLGENGGITNLTHWEDATTWVSWDFEVADGDYDVELYYSNANYMSGGHFAVTVGNGHWTGLVEDTHDWSNFAPTRLGRAHLCTGLESLRVTVVDKPKKAIMNLKCVVLTPAKS